MSAKNGPSVVASANASTSVSKSRVPAPVGSTISKFVKHSVSGQSQTASTGCGPSGSSSTSSSSAQTTARRQQASDPPPGVGRDGAAGSSSGSKLSRRDSTKSKTSESGRKNSILGWLRHHIGDGSDGGKSFGGSSTSRGVKKKLETAESFARMNHLSDSMPSLVIQASIPEAPSVTSSSGAEGTATADGNASSSASTMASSQSGDIVVNYRLRKSVVSSTTNEDRFGNEDRYGMNGTRVKASGSVRTLSGRNRWSSYELSGTAGSGMPLVTVEDSDESTTGDDDQRNSSTSVGAAHHMLMDATVGSRARSVEALHIAGAVVKVHSSASIKQQHACSSADLPSESTLATSSGLVASSTSIDDQTSLAERIQINESAENDPIENLRRTDERIEEARCYRKQVIAKILDIPSNENDVVREVAEVSAECKGNIADSDRRQLLLTSLAEADRLTSCIGSMLRLSDTADCSGDANNAVLTDRKLSSYSHFSPDRASLELFLDIGVRLRQQLALLKLAICDEHSKGGQEMERPSSLSDVFYPPATPDARAAPPGGNLLNCAESENDRNQSDSHETQQVCSEDTSGVTLDASTTSTEAPPNAPPTDCRPADVNPASTSDQQQSSCMDAVANPIVVGASE